MMRISKKTLKGEFSTDLPEMPENCWVDLVRPSAEELEFVAKETGAPAEMLKAALDENERPRVESEDGCVLVIFSIPFKESGADNGKLMVSTMPLGIIMAGDKTITVCLRENEVLNDFYSGRVRGFSTGKHTRFLIQIFARATVHFTRYLNTIEKTIDDIEKALQHSFRNEEIVRLLELQKSLVYFNNGVVSNNNVLDKIVKGRFLRLFEEDREMLDDVIIDNKQAIEMVTISATVLNSTMDAYTSIISNNLNTVMKFLTSITIVLMIPTMVASFYGMNVDLPLQENPQAFVIVIAVSFMLSGMLAYIFWRRNWF
ncbi:MAG: magnesium transporter CorA family protein [Candidatus Diapherotrites archaeon]